MFSIQIHRIGEVNRKMSAEAVKIKRTSESQESFTFFSSEIEDMPFLKVRKCHLVRSQLILMT